MVRGRGGGVGLRGSRRGRCGSGLGRSKSQGLEPGSPGCGLYCSPHPPAEAPGFRSVVRGARGLSGTWCRPFLKTSCLHPLRSRIASAPCWSPSPGLRSAPGGRMASGRPVGSEHLQRGFHCPLPRTCPTAPPRGPWPSSLPSGPHFTGLSGMIVVTKHV